MPSFSDVILKHRACDECSKCCLVLSLRLTFLLIDTTGTRKLACSKEPNGCSRCIRDGTQCHYSEQKPMGRPRKRRGQHEKTMESPNLTPPGQESPSKLDERTVPISRDTDGLPTNTDLAYDVVGGPPYVVTGEGNSTINDETPKVWHLWSNHLIHPIDFGAYDTSAGTPESTVPSEPPISILDSDLSLSSFEPAPCGCLAMMYLAMSSLQGSEFPRDIVNALSTVRSATDTTFVVTQCSSCGNCSPTNPTPPVSAFQNFMLLGTLLPIIVNSYKRLLAMIDRETEAAITSRTRKIFRLADYGGLRGLTGDCDYIEEWNHMDLSPGDWRTTVRALLRIDIYGFDPSDNHYGLTLTCVYPGLRGILALLHQRRKARDSILEEMKKAGLPMPAFGCPPQGYDIAGERNRICEQIIDTAKRVLDSLVIP